MSSSKANIRRDMRKLSMFLRIVLPWELIVVLTKLDVKVSELFFNWFPLFSFGVSGISFVFLLAMVMMRLRMADMFVSSLFKNGPLRLSDVISGDQVPFSEQLQKSLISLAIALQLSFDSLGMSILVRRFWMRARTITSFPSFTFLRGLIAR